MFDNYSLVLVTINMNAASITVGLHKASISHKP